jgi:hypothetical protein
MKQEQIIKCGGQKIKVFNCDPEKNTQCDKEFCMHNINAIDGLCNHTTNPDFALEIGQKAQKKAYTPGRKIGVLISTTETGGWPRQRRESSHMIKK